ncbi:unnamed protein product [Closterium sp. NIES-53]
MLGAHDCMAGVGGGEGGKSRGGEGEGGKGGEEGRGERGSEEWEVQGGGDGITPPMLGAHDFMRGGMGDGGEEKGERRSDEQEVGVRGGGGNEGGEYGRGEERGGVCGGHGMTVEEGRAGGRGREGRRREGGGGEGRCRKCSNDAYNYNRTPLRVTLLTYRHKRRHTPCER